MTNSDDKKRRLKVGAKRLLARPLALRREEQALLLIATITVTSIGGIGVAQAKGGYYEVGIAGQTVGCVKNAKSVEAAVDLAKAAYTEKTGKQAVRPVVSLDVEKRGLFQEETGEPLQMHELAEKLSNDVEWVISTPALVLPDGSEIAVEDEKTAKLILIAVLKDAKERPVVDEKNTMDVPKPKLENADAELQEMDLIAKEQPELQDTTFKLQKTDLYDKVKIKNVEVKENDILTMKDALALIKEGRMVPHNHVLAKGEDRDRVAKAWHITPERLEELNPKLDWKAAMNPGTKLTVERKEPLVRDKQVFTEVRQEYTPFEVSYLDDPELMIGEYKVETPGKPGVKTVTSTVERVATFEQSRTVEEEVYNKAPENAIVRRGTAETPGVAWPLKGPITSPFGERTWNNGFTEFHRGIDIAAPTGTPVKAAKSGIVTYAAEMGSYGNVVFIDHGDGFSTRYAHLSAFKCKVGDEVRMGDVIGLVGSTGNSTGPHLHFETLIDESPKNPMHFLKDGKDDKAYDPKEDYEAYMAAHGHRTVTTTNNTIVVTNKDGKTETTTVVTPKPAEVTTPAPAAAGATPAPTDVLTSSIINSEVGDLNLRENQGGTLVEKNNELLKKDNEEKNKDSKKEVESSEPVQPENNKNEESSTVTGA